MKPSRFLIVMLAALTASVPAYSQTPLGKNNEPQTEMTNKNGHEAEAPAVVPLKIQIAFIEYDGKQKIGSFPYSLYGVDDGSPISLRYGTVYPHGFRNDANFDCRARADRGGGYQIHCSAERMWWVATTTLPAPAKEPIATPTFLISFTVVASSGEMVEGSSAVDPITGHVFKVDVTPTALK